MAATRNSIDTRVHGSPADAAADVNANADGLRLGGTALVRASGVPCSMWTAAGGSGLFGRIVEHADALDRQSVHARRLAGPLSDIVADARLTDAERRAVLALRRRLHTGAAPRPADCALLEGLSAAPRELVREAGELCRASASHLVTRAELDRALGDERERVGALAWTLVSTSPVLRAFLDTAMPGLAEEVTARLADGESWSGKRLRKRSAYLWRAMGRAAAKTTPRGWVGQVAPVPVGPQEPGPGPSGTPADDPACAGGEGRLALGAVREGLLAPAEGAACAGGEGLLAPGDGTACAEGERLLAPGAALDALAATVVENVHTVRAGAGTPDLGAADPATLLAPAPLHLTDGGGGEGGSGGVLRCFAIDPGDPGRLRQVAVRRTAPLDLLLTLFAEGPRTLAELERALPAADPAVLRGFLTHLTGLGVLQPCVAPRRRHSAWTPAAQSLRSGTLPGPETEPGDREPGGWFLDSCRRLDTRVPDRAAARVQRALRTAHRLAALRRADRDAVSDAPPHAPGTERLDGRPRPLGEILTALLSSDRTPPPVPELRRYPGWHPAHSPDSGYARLLAHLASCRDRTRKAGAAGAVGADVVDVDDDLLDALGAPPAPDTVPPWPLDCLLRPLPGPGPVAVLETASPAGILDARFAEGLQALYGGYGTVEVYRDFLAAVERRAGVRFVELLVPPVTERAANAVRRPVTTRWWTGDPNAAAYFGPGGPAPRYLPLDRITLRRSGDRIVAEADGVRVVPVHHATRSPMPPYDRLVRLLLSAGHPWARTMLRLDGLAAAFPAGPGITWTPRVTVGAELVVSPATWRVPRARLWRPDDGDLDRVRVLASLGRAAGLPRFAFVRPAFEAKPVPVDLDALTALNVIERCCAALPGDELIFEEMLPGPVAGAQGPTLCDALHRGEPVAAEVMLRVPFDRTAEELAADAAAALIQDVPGPSAHRAAVAGAATQQETPRKQEESPCPSWNSPTSTP
ncbi:MULTISPECIES: lantibiotic dehydratase [unclassified Streptomyces]|uniref:lantibiotic dehydratase n=1 Tax=unclassified Streptomyces TaxID=2593676 RepID=UPI0036EA1217